MTERMSIAQLRIYLQSCEPHERALAYARLVLSWDLWRLLRNRCVQGYTKYGHITDNIDSGFPCLKRAKRRLAVYEQTGDQEQLLDAINYLLFEFHFPRHPTATWRPTDSNGADDRRDGWTRTETPPDGLPPAS